MTTADPASGRAFRLSLFAWLKEFYKKELSANMQTALFCQCFVLNSLCARAVRVAEFTKIACARLVRPYFKGIGSVGSQAAYGVGIVGAAADRGDRRPA